MPKINQEEYEILKNLDDKWKWIARDEERLSTYSSTLNVFGNEPSRRNTYWVSGFADIKGVNENLFQFIKWKDEPYNITGLIEEYEFGRILLAMAEKETVLEFESESEEKEVKKNIEWLKSKIVDYFTIEGNGFDVEGYEILDLIDQLDEPETTIHDAYDKLKEVSPLTEKSFDYYWNAINDGVELDEPEVLSQEFIDEHSYNVHLLGTPDVETIAIPRDDLQNLLVPKQEVTHEQVVEWIDNNDFYDHITAETVLANAVDKGELDHYGTKYAVVEKPTIPKFIGEVIEEHKELGYDVYDSIDLIIETNGEGLPSISDWVAINIDKYARAYLYDYTIEKEPRYFAKIKGHENISSDDKYWSYCITDESLDVGDNKVHADVLPGYVLSATKDEWANLGINEDNADFVKVKELEE